MRLANNKLSLNIIDRLLYSDVVSRDHDSDNSVIQKNVTANELDFLIFLSQRQNAFGKVYNVYYKDILLDLNICAETYYNVIDGLEKKGYITVYHGNSGYKDFLIQDNVFLSSSDDKCGYINTNKPYLTDPAFKSLKVNAKKLCLYFSKLYHDAHFKNGRTISINSIKRTLGVKSTCIILGYLDSIQSFFPTKMINNEYVSLLAGNKKLFEESKTTEKQNTLTHKFKSFCRRYHISYTTKDIADLIILLDQYKDRGIGRINNVFCSTMIKLRSIEPKLINYLLKGKACPKEQISFDLGQYPENFKNWMALNY